MKKSLIISIACILLIKCGVGCGGDSDQPAQQAGQIDPRTAGERLFDLGMSSEEMTQNRRTFLEQPIEKVPARTQHFGLVYRAGAVQTHSVHYGPPRVPGISPYGDPINNMRFVMKLPKEFRPHIPEKMIHEIKARNIQELDLFFAPQTYRLTRDVNDRNPPLFSAHYWLAQKHNENSDSSVRVLGHFSELITVGLYEAETSPMGGAKLSDCLSDNQPVALDDLGSFSQILHDGLISPRQGCMLLPDEADGFAAFYSLVISTAQKRAAVTLHWLLPPTSLTAGTFASARQATSGDLVYPLVNQVYNGSENRVSSLLEEIRISTTIPEFLKEKLWKLTEI